ncbi:MAG: hypothetical protein KAT71_04300, partial [Gammaproteobacteria bacterium]|nr:hypothetical protein [Gammaproteobacteria bacterium]
MGKETVRQPARSSWSRSDDIFISLAKLLKCNGECAAVAIINGVICIATNDLSKAVKKGTKNQHIDAINNVMRYIARFFKKDIPTEDEKKELLCELCLLAGKAELKKGASKITKDAVRRVVRSGKTKAQPNDEPEIAVLRRQFRRINKALTKIQDFLSKGEDDLEAQDVRLKLREAFQKESFRILRKEAEVGIHAEAQILAEIVEQLDKINSSQTQEIFIGISRYCCAQCYPMILGANEVFQKEEKSLVVKVAGYHGLDFKNWRAPRIFRRGYGKIMGASNTRNAKPDDTIAYRIGVRAGEIAKVEIDKLSPKDVAMTPESSASESSSPRLSGKDMINLLSARDKLLLLNQMPFKTVKANQGALLFAEKICALPSLQRFMAVDSIFMGETFPFEDIAVDVSELGINIDNKLLLTILQNSFCCGEEISHIFEGCRLSEFADDSEVDSVLRAPKRRKTEHEEIDGEKFFHDYYDLHCSELDYNEGISNNFNKLSSFLSSIRYGFQLDRRNAFGLEPYDVHFDIGDCLFAAIAAYDPGRSGADMRRLAVEHIQRDDELKARIIALAGTPENTIILGSGEDVLYVSCDDYLNKMGQPQTWGTATEATALSLALRRPIAILHPGDRRAWIIDQPEYANNDPIFVEYQGDNHYVPLANPDNSRDILRLARDNADTGLATSYCGDRDLGPRDPPPANTGMDADELFDDLEDQPLSDVEEDELGEGKGESEEAEIEESGVPQGTPPVVCRSTFFQPAPDDRQGITGS